MKKNRFLALFLCFALIGAVLTGCGGSSEAMDYAIEETWANGEASKSEPEMDGISGNTQLSEYSDPNAKLIRTVWLDAQTREYDAVMEALEEKIGQLGGYVENRDAYNGSEYYGRSNRYCSLVVRIPADRLNEFVTHVNDNCNVTNTTETVENITLEYTDTASRVEALEVEQARLLELLEEAQNLTEILEIEARLSDVRYELGSYASQLRVMDNMVSYATIYLDVSEVEKLTPVEEPTVWERISEGFMESLADVGDTLVDLVVWISVNSPWLVVWAVFITVGVIAGKTFRRRRKPKVKKEEAKPEQAE